MNTMRLALTGLALGSGFAAGEAMAQAALLNEIVVTAERRETGIQNTPIAISAFSQARSRSRWNTGHGRYRELHSERTSAATTTAMRC